MNLLESTNRFGYWLLINSIEIIFKAHFHSEKQCRISWKEQEAFVWIGLRASSFHKTSPIDVNSMGICRWEEALSSVAALPDRHRSSSQFKQNLLYFACNGKRSKTTCLSGLSCSSQNRWCLSITREVSSLCVRVRVLRQVAQVSSNYSETSIIIPHVWVCFT